MKAGITTFVTDQGMPPGPLAKAIEERGFDALLVAEHSHIPVRRETPYPGGEPMPTPYFRPLDPFVALTAAAMTTSRLVLGTSIVLLVQRDVIHTAKEVSSLDLVSGGRVLFGVGAGWNREEMRNHGTDPRTRGALLDERIEALKAIWTHDEAEFHGRFVDFDPIFQWPKPVQKPHPPIYVGGNTRFALERAVRQGVGWMPNSVADPVEVPGQLKPVPSGVSVMVSSVPPRDEILSAYAENGVTQVSLAIPPEPESATLHRLDRLAAIVARYR
ncbi:LLM class F420-dependent oxidoreductase [Amycolatopsis taiwanensis]|uniref:LLM class F420-dependent oxidoreductase n=2 Tax=Amycolatopsis taiwanensis TaxID=342230 RepID=A0A9W6R7R6_9PSEU|nr:LLM class F420-dependent oxidoreductase [Amycolatopsis taiwanensis]GLY69825.1 LLM class F420-dependent oxidoreductase [Amycolatopsis taiwanensis]